MKKTTLVLAVLALGAMLWAADNAVIAPQSTASPKLQAPRLGTEAITIPQMLSYQGKLTDTLGVPVPNGNYPTMFLLYTVPSGGSSFWSENQSVTTKDGLFSVLLGASTPISSIPDAGAVYLGMTISGGAELTPRLRIASAAYAYLATRSANSDLLQGKDTIGFVRTAQAGSVTSAMIVDGTIAAADLGQMGASSGQVMKWTGAAWVPRNDSVGGGGGGGTVRKVSQATGVVCSPNPITDSGIVSFDQTYGDGRYVNVSGDSMTARLAVAGEIRSHVRGTFGANCTNQGTNSFVAGQLCKTYAEFCNVGGGYFNQAGEPSSSDSCATVCGGYYNFNGGRFTFIGGGRKNGCSYDRGVICGGDSNGVDGPAGVVCGGIGNRAMQYSVVGGGMGNNASAYSVIGGGSDNLTSALFSAVGSGEQNSASGSYALVGGGYADTVEAPYGSVLSGYSNTAGDSSIDTAAIVCGGKNNSATGKYDFVGGGDQNNASNNYSTIAGGQQNRASGLRSVVGGGYQCLASLDHSFVGGGYADTAGALNTVVGGGERNKASGNYSTVGGGAYNTASGVRSTVTGGYYGSVSGDYSTVLGGANDTCAAGYSLVAGSSVRARSGAQYTFAFGEGCTTSVPRAVVFYHSGAATKLGVGVQTPTHNIDVAGGAYCNGTNWVNSSSRKLKADISVLTLEQMHAVLQELNRTQVVNYRYKSEASGEQHIGLIAEDAPELMATPERDGINTADAIGFLMAAVKAQQAEIEQLKAEMAKQKR